MVHHLGRVCRECREEAGVRQLDVAEAAGVSHAAVSRFENGKATPKIGLDRLVGAYAAETGVPAADLWAQAVSMLG